MALQESPRLKAAANAAIEAERQRIRDELKNRIAELERIHDRLVRRTSITRAQLNAFQSREEGIQKDWDHEFAVLAGNDAVPRNRRMDEHLLKIVLLNAEFELLPDRIKTFEDRLAKQEAERDAVKAELDELKKELAES